MKRVCYRQDREAVLVALRAGQRPELVTTMACGPVDALVALHDALALQRYVIPEALKLQGFVEILPKWRPAAIPIFH